MNNVIIMAEKQKSLSKGGMFYLISNVSNMAFPFLTGLYVARILLPETIGEVAAAQNLAQYFIILAFLGIPTYGSREIAKTRNEQKERSRVYSELLIINFISTCIFSIAYVFLILSINEYRIHFDLYLIVGISIALNALNNTWLFEGLEEFSFISVRNLIFKAISFVLLLVFVRDGSDYLYYAAITVVGTAGNYIVNFLYAPRFASFCVSDVDIKRHLKPIFFLVAVNLAIELYSLVDITMMNFLCKKESIAFYKYGNSIQKMLLQVVNTFTMVIVPRMTFYYKEKRFEQFNLLISKGLKLIFIVSIPMIIGIYFTSDALILKMYGGEYSNSATVLKFLSFLLLISPIGYLLGSRVLLVTGHENKMLIAVGIGAVVNIIGNAILIPLHQEFGATMASVVSEIVVMVVYVILGRNYYKLCSIKDTVFKTLITGMIMAAYLYGCSILPINEWMVLIFQIVGAVLIYGSVLVLLKEEVSLQYIRIAYEKIQRHK